MKPPPVRAYVFTWLALLALLATTFALAHVPMGHGNVAASLAIAALKALLVALFFMHLRRASTLVVLFAIAAFVWLALLYGLSATDYATRAVNPAPWSAPPR